MNSTLIRSFANNISILFLFSLFFIYNSANAGTWTPLNNQPTFLNPSQQCLKYPNANCAPPGTFSSGITIQPMLMTDGSVLFGTYVCTSATCSFSTGKKAILTGQAILNGSGYYAIYKLTPDIHGSYQNGTWTRLADLPNNYAPYAFGQAVLADGRIIYIGGEYEGAQQLKFAFSSKGAVYDPVINKWTSLSPPTFFANLWPKFPYNERYPSPFTSTVVNPIGDAQTVVLPDGRFMIADKLSKQSAILDPSTMTWNETGTATKNDWNSEESWVLLPNGKVLTIDLYIDFWALELAAYPNGYPNGPENSEIYDPATGNWSTAGSTVVQLSKYPFGEIGPSLLLPDGRVFTSGVTSPDNLHPAHTAFYNSISGNWSAGPDFPLTSDGKPQGAGDNMAALLPNGNVFMASNQGPNYYEFDGSNFIHQPSTPDTQNGIVTVLYFLPLPNGQILFADGNTDIELYTSDNTSHNPAWEPVIQSAPSLVQPGGCYMLSGLHLNGMSQACAEGDDNQCATNFPLVRITNLSTGHVFYSRTHDFSSMAVANPNPVSTKFDVPTNQELGPSKLEVIANGIPSAEISINVIY